MGQIGIHFLYKKDPVWVLFPGSDGTKELILTLLFIIVMFCTVFFFKRLRLPLFIVYFCALIYFTFLCRKAGTESRLLGVPFDVIKSSFSFEDGFHIKDSVTFNAMILNVLLFVPFGCILPTVIRICRKAWFMIPAGLLISLIIETLQYFTRLGVFDVDDLILNTFGTTLGYLLFFFFIKKKTALENNEKKGIFL